jgi:hypothetical protein
MYSRSSSSLSTRAIAFERKTAHSRLARACPGYPRLLVLAEKRRGYPGQAHGCPARFLLMRSTRNGGKREPQSVLSMSYQYRHARACPGYRARASAFCQGGASPPQAHPFGPVMNRNCVARRRGGKQRGVKETSVAIANSIRPDRTASLRCKGEARTRENGEAMALRRWVSKRPWRRLGGWRRKALKSGCVTYGDLRGSKGCRTTLRSPPPRRSQSTHSSDEAG